MKKISYRTILLLLFSLQISCTRSQDKDPVTKTSNTQVASIGMHIMNIYQVDMSTNSFYADFYLWCRWKGTIDPLKNIEFINSEDQWGFTRNLLYDSALILENNIRYNILHVQGRFHHSFMLDNYPLDEQKISIELENSIYTAKELVYEPDTVNSNIQPEIKIPGWTIDNFKFSMKDHVYKTNFGLPENPSNDSYSNLSVSLSLQRPIEFFVWKLLLPIIIVLLSGLGATLMNPSYTDARIYAPVGALLTTVFLQQSYSSNLPDISYLILTDKIYVIVYIAILAGIFQAIYTANLVKAGTAESFIKAKRLDRVYTILMIIFLIGASLVLILQSRI